MPLKAPAICAIGVRPFRITRCLPLIDVGRSTLLSKKLKPFKVESIFVLPPTFSIAKLSEELRNHIGDRLTLTPQPAIGQDAQEWSTGILQLDGSTFRVFLDVRYIDEGNTDSEREYIRHRKGHTDVYKLIFRGPEPEETPLPGNLLLAELELKLQAILASFLKRLGANVFDGHSYAWADYADF